MQRSKDKHDNFAVFLNADQINVKLFLVYFSGLRSSHVFYSSIYIYVMYYNKIL